MIFGGEGSLYAVHAGLELSTCRRDARLCAFFGGDVGWAHSSFAEQGLFQDNMSGSGMIGVVRGGLDLGGKHLRWRPGFEVMVGGVQAAAVTQAIAWRL